MTTRKQIKELRVGDIVIPPWRPAASVLIDDLAIILTVEKRETVQFVRCLWLKDLRVYRNIVDNEEFWTLIAECETC
jgi:hypothetical protein